MGVTSIYGEGEMSAKLTEGVRSGLVQRPRKIHWLNRYPVQSQNLHPFLIGHKTLQDEAYSFIYNKNRSMSMKRHISILAVCLIIAAMCYAVCAFGLTTEYQKIATMSGFGLFLIMTIGFFYATLHLSKVK